MTICVLPQPRPWKAYLWCLILIFGNVLMPPLLKASSRKDRQRASELFEKARHGSDIAAAGIPAFVLRANVHFQGVQGAGAVGKYVLWVSRRKWRSEFSTSGYVRLVVSDGKASWQVSNLKYTPYVVFAATRALWFAQRLWVPPREAVKVRGRRVEGTRCACVELHGKGEPRRTREFCFAPGSEGRLVRERDDMWGTTCLYSGYAHFGKKVFPQKIRVYMGNNLLLEEDVQQFAPLPHPDPALFVIPTGSQVVRLGPCTKFASPKIITEVHPAYPEAARQARDTGDVHLYGVIGRDGKVRGVTVIQSAGKLLNAAAISAVKHWRFRPASCDGVPMPDPRPFNVVFQLK